jgi:hypothetical protein
MYCSASVHGEGDAREPEHERAGSFEMEKSDDAKAATHIPGGFRHLGFHGEPVPSCTCVENSKIPM